MSSATAGDGVAAGGAGARVARVELYHFSTPLPATFRPSWLPGFPQNENRCTMIRVVTEDGVEGWSAGASIGRERAGLGDLVGPYLIGEDATDIAAIQQRLREMSYLGWRNWWIEPAFWDIRGKMAGEPVWRLLGGEDAGSVRLYASTGQVRAPADRVREAEERHEEGFRAIRPSSRVGAISRKVATAKDARRPSASPSAWFSYGILHLYPTPLRLVTPIRGRRPEKVLRRHSGGSLSEILDASFAEP